MNSLCGKKIPAIFTQPRCQIMLALVPISQAKLGDIAATGDGIEVLRLGTDRPWSFFQKDTGLQQD